MAIKSIFTTQIADSVANSLNLRKLYAGDTNFTIETSGAAASDKFEWLYKKHAFVHAKVIVPNPIRSPYRVTTSELLLYPNPYSGFPKPKSGGGTTHGQYQQLNYGPEGRLFPTPHITNFKTYTAGDFGSLRKCELNFTIYTYSQLAEYQPFFDLGAKLIIDYGWHKSGGAFGSNGRFEGVVFNFYQTVNEKGGWDCQVSGMGPGINILKTSNQIVSDTVIKHNSTASTKAVKNLFGRIVSDCIDFNKTITDPALSTNELPSAGIVILPNFTKTSLEMRSYVTLERLVKDIVSFLRNTNDKFKELNIICDYETTRGTTPGINAGSNLQFITPNPFKIIFSNLSLQFLPPESQAAFNINYDFAAASGSSWAPNSAQNAFNGDLSKILLNLEWLRFELEKIQKDPVHPKESAKAYTSMMAFLQKIFDTIFIQSGERWKLALVPHPTDNMTFQIVEIEYCNIQTKDIHDFPYEFTAVGSNSKSQPGSGICRSVDIKTNIPDSVATSTYLANRSTATEVDMRSLGPLVAGNDSAYTPPPNTGPNAGVDQVQQFNEYVDKHLSLNFTIEELDEDGELNQLERAFSEINKFWNFDGKEKLYNDNQPKNERDAPPWPISLNVVTDGIAGFEFGNMITCNMIPEKYKKPENNIIFTITKVEDTISDGDWQTRIETIIRIAPERS